MPARFDFPIETEGERLDAWLLERLGEELPERSFTRSYLQGLFSRGLVTVGGKAAGKGDRIRPGLLVSVELPDPDLPEARPQNIPLAVVYEDDDLIVIDKPRGMVVHPAAGNPDNTLVNALLWHCGHNLSGINGVLRPGIVHRIDKDTSGLLVAAKSERAHLSLAGQFFEHSVERMYWAVVHGIVAKDEGRIDLPIGRAKNDRKKFAVVEGGRRAVTNYSVAERFSAYTLVSLRLETGRTHQIRVHMAALGHPLAGDPVYGPRSTPKSLGGQCLHAATLGFTHPDGRHLRFESPLPEYFTNFLAEISGDNGAWRRN